MEQLGQAVGFGIVTASVIALAAVGLSLQVSVTNFVNFAYGDVMTLGAYVAYVANLAGLPLPLAAVVGGIVIGLFAVALNIAVFAPFVRRRARVITLLIVTLGLAFIIQNGALIIWGPDAYHYNVNYGQEIHIGPIVWTVADIGIIATGAILLLALHGFLQFTTIGKALRATSNNVELASACGINTGRVVTGTWAASGFFAAIAGVGLALETNTLDPGLGFSALFLVFGSIILGGIGRIYGAMLGAVVLGIVTEVAGMYVNAAYKIALAFAILVVLLLIRPQGLFAAPGRSS